MLIDHNDFDLPHTYVNYNNSHNNHQQINNNSYDNNDNHNGDESNDNNDNENDTNDIQPPPASSAELRGLWNKFLECYHESTDDDRYLIMGMVHQFVEIQKYKLRRPLGTLDIKPSCIWPTTR